MPSYADLEYDFYKSFGYTGTIGDVQFQYYSDRSGLTPKASYSLADHMRAYFTSKNGLTTDQAAPYTGVDLEDQYLRSKGFTEGTVDDRWNKYYEIGGLLNYKDATMQAWYDARYPNGFVNKVPENLLTYNQATIEIDTQGLAAGNNCSGIVRSTAQARSGSASLAGTVTATSSATLFGQGTSAANAVSVIGGNTYTAMLSHYGPRSGNVALRVYWYTSGWAAASTTNNAIGPISVIANQWTDFIGQVTAPADAAYGVILVYLYSATCVAGEVHYIDQLGLFAGTVNQWVSPVPNSDGDPVSYLADLSGNSRNLYQGVPAARPVWRTQGKNLLTYNQATLEQGVTDMQAVARCTIARSSSIYKHGAWSLGLTVTSDGNTAAGTNYGSLQYRAPVVGGTRYTATVSGRSATVARDLNVVIRWYDSGGGMITEVGPTATTGSTSAWVTSNHSAIAPANATSAAVYGTFANALTGEIHYLDNFGIWEGTDTTWTLPAQTVNGKPVIQFDGVDDLLINSNLNWPVGDTGRSIYLVVLNPIDNGTKSQFAGTYGASTAFGVGLGASGGFTYSRRLTADANSAVAGGSALGYSTGTWAVVSGVVDYTTPTETSSLKGTATVETPSWTAGTPDPLTQLILAFQGGGSQCLIAAALIFNTKHDAATRNKIEKILGSMFGVAIS